MSPCTHAHRFPDHWLAWRARRPGEQIRYCPACQCWVTEPVNDDAAVVFSVSDTREAA